MCEYKKHKQLGTTQFIPGEMMRVKTTKLGHTAFIVGGDNEPRKTKMGKPTKAKMKGPEFVRDEYEQGVAQMNKGASSTSLIVTHGRK